MLTETTSAASRVSSTRAETTESSATTFDTCASRARTPAVLDHLYYPHIWDAIFDYARGQSLAVLCKVSNKIRKRVFAKFRHLYDLAIYLADLPSMAVHLAFKAEIDGPELRLLKRASDSLNNVHAVDVRCCSRRTHFHLVDMPNLRTLRFACSPPPSFDVPDSVQEVICNGFINTNFLWETNVRHLVVNLPWPYQYWIYAPVPPQLQTIAVICNGDQDDYFVGLIPFLYAAVEINALVSLVGAVSPYEWHHEFDYGHSVGCRDIFVHLLGDETADRVLRSNNVARESYVEYQERVGEAQWEMEFNVPPIVDCRGFHH